MQQVMIFESIGGLASPCLPGTLDGAPIKADGVRLFDLAQAAAYFGTKEAALRELYQAHERNWETFKSLHTPEPDPAYVPGVSEDEIGQVQRLRFPHLAREHVVSLKAYADQFGFNLWANHVTADLRPDEEGRPRLVPLVMVEGLCARAHATKEFAGAEAPDILYDEAGNPEKAVVVVYRLVSGEPRPFPGEAHYSNLYPGAGVSSFWDRMPHRMLTKCATATALRLAFPDCLSGLYCPEEMAQSRTVGGGGGRTRRPGQSHGVPAEAPADADPQADAPQDRVQLKLRMIDYGFRDEAQREAVIARFRKLYRHMGDSPLFYASVFKAIRDNPEAYGGRAPAA